MKEEIYQKLISQLEATEKEGYYFESAWITYVILEDRLCSILGSSGGELNSKGKQIKMMGPKIGEIQTRMNSNDILKGHLETKNLIPRLNEWKDKRNALMHSMANGTLSIVKIKKEITLLAYNGIELTRDFASAARRIKKHKT